MCLGKESKKKKSKIKMRQCLGTNLNSLTWRFPTCVLFILYNAFFPICRHQIEISDENKTKPLSPC